MVPEGYRFADYQRSIIQYNIRPPARIAFDAGRKNAESGNLGLNVLGVRGSSPFLQSLFILVIRWKSYKFIFVADFSMMYYQFLLAEFDQH